MFEEFRAFMTLLSQALMTQVNREEVASANPTGGMVPNRVMEFLRINPSEFYGLKIDEDPNALLMRCIRSLQSCEYLPLKSWSWLLIY